MAPRILTLAIVAALLAPLAAHAAEGPHGRSFRTQAALDATLWSRHTRVQVLTSVCTRPARQRGCSPMSTRLREALEEALSAPITWVDERRRNGPTFLVFAPVRFEAGEAIAELAYHEPRGSCVRGGYRTWFSRDRGVWRPTLQLGWASCAATF